MIIIRDQSSIHQIGTVEIRELVRQRMDDLGGDAVCLGTRTAQIRVALLSSMATVARRGNLKNFTDWLDPEGVTVLVYEAF